MESLICDIQASHCAQRVDIVKEAFKRFKTVRGGQNCSKEEFFDLFNHQFKSMNDSEEIKQQILYIIEHNIFNPLD